MNERIGGKQKRFLVFLALLIPVYIAVTAFFYLIGPTVIKKSLPVVETVIQRTYPDVELTGLEYSDSGGRRQILYRMKVTKWIEGIDIPLIDYLDSTLYISSQFVTAVIFYTLLFSWPFLTARKRIIAAVVSIPVIAAFLLIDIPVSAIVSIELECQNKLPGFTLQESLHRKAFIFLGHFFNNGGRQFLGVFLFILAVIPFHLSGRRSANKSEIGRNDPCPCGSGKKYKNCCMKK